MNLLPRVALVCVLFVLITKSFGQSSQESNLVYVDKKGVLRYTRDNKEASFFGVNYTVPFAYSYRAHKALNVDLEKAIQQDVYQMARLGLDAFRVHVWDTEISDSAGNLLENEHLRLFDFLLSELKKRNIKTIITPIAFWGNGYPERDEATPGFSRKYGKGKATTNDTAIAAQENYLKQLFRHVNPYTHLTYVSDADIIAVELNNEPSHSGPKQGVTNYINRLVAAIKTVGWTKPLYYNIAQNPFYADAVAKANVDGMSFQWYPTGLVANREQKGNLLPNVDHYTIPYDTIPEYRTKSKMVYEFDAADVLQSCMYPAMARSFREAGFQWATQFAYDPTALAYANTEYQTHYLNLLYTPSKAISLLIASKAFHKLPRLKSFGSYPADSSFDVFRVSYKNSLSEMNSEEEFYYSNNTDTKPVDPSKLEHIAGVGSSAVIQYEGSGAYFLDKMRNGFWRLEVMPDAIHIRDPFERASPKKEVARLEWRGNSMHIHLPDLMSFSIKGINDGNKFYATASGSFQIEPGTYLLKENNVPVPNIDLATMKEFACTKPLFTEPFLRHEPFKEVSAGKSFTVVATIVGLDSGKATLQINKPGGSFGSTREIPMVRRSLSNYSAEVPTDFVSTGLLTYRIIFQKANEFTVFPNNHTGNPNAWDNLDNDNWKTFVVSDKAKLEIFNSTIDQSIRTYPVFSRGFQTSYPTGIEPGQLILRLSATGVSPKHPIGFACYVADKMKGRQAELDSFEKLVIRVRNIESEPVKAKITLVNKNAFAFSSFITLTNSFRDIELPLDKLLADSLMLLPRPYPEFMPVWFKAQDSSSFKLSDIEQIQLTVGSDFTVGEVKKPCTIEVSSIWLEKKK
ncbi:MAG: membrane or secreted protein [Flavisolibacter sp.]